MMASATGNEGPDRADIQATAADGRVSVAETVTIVFYSRTAHLDMRDEVAASIRAFGELVSLEELNAYYDDEADEQDLDPATLDAIIQDRFYSPGHAQNATITLVGGGFYARDFFLDYAGTAADNPDVPDEATYLWCWVPRRFFLANRARVLDFATNTARRLPFTFGYVSPGLAGQDKQRKQALGARYPGLDLARPMPIAADIADRAAGAYWINFLGPALAERLGGEAGLRAALPADVTVDALGGGKCRVTLGPEPEIGDVNRRELLPLHQALARLLDARGLLAIPKRGAYFVDANDDADREAMERWHRRFLAP